MPYLGTPAGDPLARLAATEDAIWKAKRALSLEAATYLGTFRGRGTDPTVWGELEASFAELQAGLSSWTKKLRDIKAVNGKVNAGQWALSAHALADNGDQLARAVEQLNASLRKRLVVTRVLGFSTNAVKIVGGTALVDIPKVLAKTGMEGVTRGLRATRAVVHEAGGVLQEAGGAIGGTLGAITGPVKTVLIVGGIAAGLYFLWPVLKGMGMGMEAKHRKAA